MMNPQSDKYHQFYTPKHEKIEKSFANRPISLLLLFATLLFVFFLYFIVTDNTLDTLWGNGTKTDSLFGFSIRPTAQLFIPPTPLIEPSQKFFWQDVPVSAGDTLLSLLSDLNINAQDLADILTIPIVKKQLSHLKIGDNISIKIDNDNHLMALRYPISTQEVLNVAKKNNKYVANVARLQTQIEDKTASGTIGNSLYLSALHAGLNRKTITQLIHIFSTKINFSHDLKPGDTFEVIYQDKFNQSQHIGTGDILAARLYINGKPYTAIGFKSHSDKLNYYSPTGAAFGNPTKGEHLLTPVHFIRVSSPFNMHRIHPILHINRPHEGVDLAAPRGTPVKAAASGKIIYKGRDGGYGNLIAINNGNGIVTRYAHLEKFTPHLYLGEQVTAGQVIAYVGSTGLATGPHLHFEVRIHNKPENPLKFTLPEKINTLSYKEKQRFLAQSSPLLEELDRMLS